ncbi:MAG: phosphoesterase, partial [Lachnospiraceae bacterium]|nr:phosphoesterase [Lachnospiraceae bacterium]
GHVHNTYDEVLIDQFQKQTRASKRRIMGTEEMRRIPCNMINCFCMYSDYVPLTLDEWIELDEKRREKM